MAIETWLNVAAGANTAPVPVVCVGSSTTAGNNALVADRRYVDVLSAILRARHNSTSVPGGLGYTAYGGGYAGHGWTRSGGTPVTNRGLGFTAWQMAPGDFIERTFTGTAVTVLFEQGPGAGAFDVSIDGGAATTVTPDTSGFVTRNDGVWTSDNLSVGQHTVRITAVETCVIEGVYLHNGDETSGIQVHNSGLGGATSFDLINTPGLITRLAQIQPKLVILMMTSNDYASGTDPAVTKDRHQSWLNSLFASVSPNPRVLLVQAFQRLDVTTPAFPWAAYGTALKEIADADPDRISYLDISNLYPLSQGADVYDLIDSDDTHQTDRGHQVMADAIANHLGLSITYDDSIGRVRVTASVGIEHTTATVERSLNQVNWTTFAANAPTTNGVVSVDDFGFSLGDTNFYRVRAGERILDTFSRNVTDDWGTTDTGQTWTEVGGVPSDFQVAGGVGTHSVSAVSSSRRSLIGSGVLNDDAYASVATNATASGASQQPSHMFRYQDQDNLLMAQARLNTDTSVSARLVARIAGVETELMSYTVPGLTHTPGTFLRFRAQMLGTLFRMKVWLATDPEPPTWYSSALTTAIMVAGQGGLRSILAPGNTNTLPVVFSWDDYESPETVLSGSLDVPGAVYTSYAQLAANETEGVDYTRTVISPPAGSVWASIAIHGGAIEPGSGEVAREVAQNGQSMHFYEFAGIKPSNNFELHIESTLFDEPLCLNLLSNVDKTLSFHGFVGSDEFAEVRIGGLDIELRDRILNSLRAAGFNASIATAEIAGTDPDNICNKNRRSAGVQIEMSRQLRRMFFPDGDLSSANRAPGIRTPTFYSFVNAIIAGLEEPVTPQLPPPPAIDVPLGVLHVTYVFGDLRTGEIMEELPLWSVSMMDELNADGELRGTFQLDTTGKRNEDIVAATIPGRCYMVMEVNGFPMFGGIIFSRTYQSTAKTIQLYVRGFEVYPYRRFIREPITMTGDQIAIFCFLWNHMQSQPNSNLLVEVPTPFNSGVIKTITTEPHTFRTYGLFMTQLSDAIDGFDWKIRLVREGNAYRRILDIGYPVLGAPARPDSIVLEYPGAITNYWETDVIGDAAGTNIFVTGAGEGSSMLTSEQTHDFLLQNGWLRFDFHRAYKDVTDPNLLEKIARNEARIRRAPATVLKAEIKANLDPIFGSYGLGDFMNVVINDPKHDKVTIPSRVIRWEFWPPEQANVSHAILTFESVDEDPGRSTL